MKIGILSDTHNDSAITLRALQEFRRCGVRTLFHCGDLTVAEMVAHFDGLEVYFVRGNMDRQQVKALKAAVATRPGAHWLGRGDLIELEGKFIAITHGDRMDVVKTLFLAQPDYFFHGHTHRRRDERAGPTRIINPGALGGTQHETRSVCVLDLDTGQLDVFKL